MTDLEQALAMAKTHFGSWKEMTKHTEGPNCFLAHFRVLAEAHGLTHGQAGVIAMCLIRSNEIKRDIERMAEGN